MSIQVEKFPTLLFWDRAFPGGIPRQYYKSYGLTKSGLVQWLQKQITCTKNGSDQDMCATSVSSDTDPASSTSQKENTDQGGKRVIDKEM